MYAMYAIARSLWPMSEGRLAELGRLAADLANNEQVNDPLPLPEPLALSQLQSALSHEGDLVRLRCFMRKLRSGANVTIAAVGGSITAGAATTINRNLNHTYHVKAHRWLQSRYPHASLRHATAAIPSVYHEDYMEHCLNMHVPQSADLVLVDLPSNLCGNRQAECDNAMIAVESMLRNLLDLPSRPPIVFVNSFMFWQLDGPSSWARSKTPRQRKASASKKAVRAAKRNASSDLELDGLEFHRQWGHARHEHMLDELAKYYSTPSISLRDVIFHQAKSAPSMVNGMPLKQLYNDRIHPNTPGHTILAQALIYLFKRAALMLEVEPPARCAAAALPPPMQAKAKERHREVMRCLGAHALLRLLEGEACSGWGLVVAGSRRGPTSGMHYLTTDRPGSVCRIGLGMAPTDRTYPNEDPAKPLGRYVGIAYRAEKTPEMGRARFECAAGCECSPLIVDAAARTTKEAHVRLAKLEVKMSSASLRCSLRVSSLSGANRTAAKKAVFSIAALLVNPFSARSFFGEWLLRRALASHAQGHASDLAALGPERVVGWDT